MPAHAADTETLPAEALGSGAAQVHHLRDGGALPGLFRGDLSDRGATGGRPRPTRPQGDRETLAQGKEEKRGGMDRSMFTESLLPPSCTAGFAYTPYTGTPG